MMSAAALASLAVLLMLCVIDPAAGAAAENAFHLIATPTGVGGVLASAVGAGPTPGSERLYLSYIYADDRIELVAVDPETGAHEVFPTPVAGEYGAWGMAVGPDGAVYLGTLPHAHILKLDWQRHALVDLGRPAPSEQYIWGLTFGSDHKLYGCTYPSAKLVRFDPAAGTLEDLGRMDPTEQYGRSVAASDDGFIYVGIGTSKSHVVAFEIATGVHRDILPAGEQITGTAQVYRAADGSVYAQAPNECFKLKGWDATPCAAEGHPPAPRNQLHDGREVVVDGREVVVTDPHTRLAVRHPYTYEGRALPIFRLAAGPDGMLYASSILPIHFLRIDPASGRVVDLGNLGGGEFYSFLRHGDRLLMAAYSGRSPLMSYDPTRPFHPAAPPTGNPELVTFEGHDSGWRPQALIAGPDGKIYIGAVSGYGKLGGPLAAWDVGVHHVEVHNNVIPDESVVSLTVAGAEIVGGTTVGGGGGSHPTQTEAHLFVWSPAGKNIEYDVTPVPGAADITDLVSAADGLVYGIAGQKTLFIFDPRQRKVVHTGSLPFHGVVYNALVQGPGGLLWGLAAEGIFTVNPADREVRLVARSPEPISAGVSLVGNDLYFAAGASIYRYHIQP